MHARVQRGLFLGFRREIGVLQDFFDRRSGLVVSREAPLDQVAQVRVQVCGVLHFFVFDRLERLGYVASALLSRDYVEGQLAGREGQQDHAESPDVEHLGVEVVGQHLGRDVVRGADRAVRVSRVLLVQLDGQAEVAYFLGDPGVPERWSR